MDAAASSSKVSVAPLTLGAAARGAHQGNLLPARADQNDVHILRIGVAEAAQRRRDLADRAGHVRDR